MTNSQITPFLWFQTRAEDAANFYVGLFENSSVKSVDKVGEDSAFCVVNFTLRGQDFIGIEGGDIYQMTPGVSFVLHCETQAEVDHLWNAFSEGGNVLGCGWVTDQFGVTWQVSPTCMGRMMTDPNKAKAEAVNQAMQKMGKIVIADLQAAYDSAE